MMADSGGDGGGQTWTGTAAAGRHLWLLDADERLPWRTYLLDDAGVCLSRTNYSRFFARNRAKSGALYNINIIYTTLCSCATGSRLTKILGKILSLS